MGSTACTRCGLGRGVGAVGVPVLLRRARGSWSWGAVGSVSPFSVCGSGWKPGRAARGIRGRSAGVAPGGTRILVPLPRPRCRDLVPIAEELALRGYLLRRLQGAKLDTDMTGRWNWFAVLVSSVLFGLLHPGRWIAGTLAGVFFAWAFYRRGRLSDAILAHAVTNAVSRATS